MTRLLVKDSIEHRVLAVQEAKHALFAGADGAAEETAGVYRQFGSTMQFHRVKCRVPVRSGGAMCPNRPVFVIRSCTVRNVPRTSCLVPSPICPMSVLLLLLQSWPQRWRHLWGTKRWGRRTCRACWMQCDAQYTRQISGCCILCCCIVTARGMYRLAYRAMTFV